MSLIDFTDADVKADMLVDPAWYHVRVDRVGEGVESKDKGSMNYPVSAVIIKDAGTGSTTFAGVPLEGSRWNWNFNSKMKPALIKFAKALSGEEVKAGDRLDTENLSGELECFIDNSTYNGTTKNDVKHQYRPVGGWPTEE